MNIRLALRGSLVGMVAAVLTLPVHASIVNIIPVSGLPGLQIAPPTNALNGDIESDRNQLGFDERQNVTLIGPLTITDNGSGGTSISAGTRVSSHMILLNRDNDTGNPRLDSINDWVFDGEILGWMSDVNGVDEANSAFLGAIGTNYASYNNRGLEANDMLSLQNAFTLRVEMHVTQPGDWIRVITKAVPEPATVLMLGLGLVGVGFAGRRRKA